MRRCARVLQCNENACSMRREAASYVEWVVDVDYVVLEKLRWGEPILIRRQPQDVGSSADGTLKALEDQNWALRA